MLVQARKAIIKLKNKELNNPMRELAKTLVVQSGTFLKRMNALIRSAKPKGPQDHRRQL